MSDETIDNEIEMTAEEGMDSAEYGEKSAGTPPHSDYDPTTMKDSITHHLSGMYKTGFWTMPATLFLSVPCRTSSTD